MMPWNFGSAGLLPFERFGGIGLVPLLLWSLIWAGLALWHAARRGDKWWFIIFLFVHTLGILEILYLVFVVRILEQPKTSPKKRT
ncbi:DUF5652 family protein [Patescibacteria group bacterium]|nr:DUF5652 family protein [Patescibacteria group bacterium]